MNKTINKNYAKINRYIIQIGGVVDEIDGFYIVNSKSIDLTASGDEPWQITKNILEQLK